MHQLSANMVHNPRTITITRGMSEIDQMGSSSQVPSMSV